MNSKHLRGGAFGILLAVLTVAGFPTHSTGESKVNNELSILLRPKSTVLGPVVTLGDIGRILIPDDSKQKALSSVKLGEAPPPGEGMEITLSHIRKALKGAALEEYVQYLKGPRTVRIVTAEKEIDKAFLRDAFASIVAVIEMNDGV